MDPIKVKFSRCSLLCLALGLAALAAILNRIFYGVELSDEVLAVAESYLVARGAVPFATMWFPSAFAMLSAPAVKLFLLLNGGSTEGIVLFMRIMFLVFKAVVMAVFCLLFRKVFPRRVLYLSVVFLLPFEYFNLLTFSYTLSSVFLLFLSMTFLVAAFWEESSRKKAVLLSALGGIIGAASVLAHPSFAVGYVAMVVVAFLYERITGHTSHRFLGLLGGSVLAAVAVTGYMILRAGSITRVVESVWNSLFLRPSAETANDTGPSYFLNDIKFLIVTLSPWLGLLLGFLTVSALRHTLCARGMKANNAGWLSGVVYAVLAAFLTVCNVTGAPFSWSMCLTIMLALWVSAAILCSVLCRRQGKALFPSLFSEKSMLLTVSVSLVIFFCGTLLKYTGHSLATHESIRFTAAVCVPPFLSTLLLLPFGVRRTPRLAPVFVFLWGSSAAWMFSVVLTTDGFGSRTPGLLGGIVCYLLFILILLPEVFPGKKTLASCLAVLLPVLLTGMFAFNLFAYSYEEAPLAGLDTPVTQGVYKGLYTTADRAKSVMELENTLREQTSRDEQILFLDNVPMAYLMTDASGCTPTAWDGSNYSNGANDDIWYLTYFEDFGKTPDKIIYIDTGRNDHVSILEDGYEFNDFVNEHYELTAEDKDAGFPLMVFSRK